MGREEAPGSPENPGNKDRLRAIAFHEAGHAVMGWRCGARFRSMTLRAARGASGGVWFCEALHPESLTSPSQVERAALIYMAGPMAAWPFERRFRAASARRDLEQAYALVQQGAASWNDARARWGLLKERAWNILAEERAWRAVCALAQALIERETLPGRAARSLIERAWQSGPPSDTGLAL